MLSRRSGTGQSTSEEEEDVPFLAHEEEVEFATDYPPVAHSSGSLSIFGRDSLARVLVQSGTLAAAAVSASSARTPTHTQLNAANDIEVPIGDDFPHSSSSRFLEHDVSSVPLSTDVSVISEVRSRRRPLRSAGTSVLMAHSSEMATIEDRNGGGDSSSVLLSRMDSSSTDLRTDSALRQRSSSRHAAIDSNPSGPRIIADDRDNNGMRANPSMELSDARAVAEDRSRIERGVGLAADYGERHEPVIADGNDDENNNNEEAVVNPPLDGRRLAELQIQQMSQMATQMAAELRNGSGNQLPATVNPRGMLLLATTVCFLVFSLIVFKSAQWLVTFNTTEESCDCNASLWMAVHLFFPALGPLLLSATRGLVLNNELILRAFYRLYLFGYVHCHWLCHCHLCRRRRRRPQSPPVADLGSASGSEEVAVGSEENEVANGNPRGRQHVLQQPVRRSPAIAPQRISGSAQQVSIEIDDSNAPQQSAASSRVVVGARRNVRRVPVRRSRIPTRAQRRRWDRNAQRVLLSEKNREVLHVIWYVYGVFEWCFHCHNCTRENHSLYLIFTLTLIVGVLERTLKLSFERCNCLSRDSNFGTHLRLRMLRFVTGILLTENGRQLINDLNLADSYDLEIGMRRLARGRTNEDVISQLPTHSYVSRSKKKKRANDESDEKVGEFDDDEKAPLLVCSSQTEVDSKRENEARTRLSSSEEEESESEDRHCSICLGVFEGGDTVMTLPVCLHEFHAQCVSRWLLDKNTCPICRNDVVSALTATQANASAIV